MIHIDKDVPLDVAVNELAGMAARRLAIAQYRAKGMSWSVARKISLTAIADDEMKDLIRADICAGVEPKDAVRNTVEKLKVRS